MSIDQFIDQGGSVDFIKRMAAGLRLNESQVKVTSIKSGSVIVEYKVIFDDNTS